MFTAKGIRGEVRFISWPQCSRSPEFPPVGRAPPAGSPGEERIWCASMLGAVRRIRGAEAARRGAVRWPCPLPPHVPFRWGSAAAATMAPAHRTLASRAVRLCLRGLRVFGISVLHTNTKGIFVFLKTGSTWLPHLTTPMALTSVESSSDSQTTELQKDGVCLGVSLSHPVKTWLRTFSSLQGFVLFCFVL